MKKLLVVVLMFAASSAYGPALAGGCGGGGGGCGPAVKGAEFACTYQCPLAQATNSHRSLGGEAIACSDAVKASMADAVVRSLSKI